MTVISKSQRQFLSATLRYIYIAIIMKGGIDVGSLGESEGRKIMIYKGQKLKIILSELFFC